MRVFGCNWGDHLSVRCDLKDGLGGGRGDDRWLVGVETPCWPWLGGALSLLYSSSSLSLAIESPIIALHGVTQWT